MRKHANFRPAWWLRNSHVQTVWRTFCRPAPKIPLKRERFWLSDGDFLDLDWTPEQASPLGLILHGLEGGSCAPYTRSLLQVLHATGFQAVVMHFRGCSGEPNLSLRRYHAGETQDLTEVMAELRHRFPQRAIYAIGYSLGGNVLLKWLGEAARPDSLSGAIAISVPFSLGEVTKRLNRGFSRFYRRYLLNRLIASTYHKTSMPGFPLDAKSLLRLPDIRSFDEHVTAPLHGFASAEDYYKRSSCRQYLKTITVPTLILHALDDPFMTAQAIPNQDELAEVVDLEVSARGGHVGFISGGFPWKPRYWLESRIIDWLRERTRASEKKELPDPIAGLRQR